MHAMQMQQPCRCNVPPTPCMQHMLAPSVASAHCKHTTLKLLVGRALLNFLVRFFVLFAVNRPGTSARRNDAARRDE